MASSCEAIIAPPRLDRNSSAGVHDLPGVSFVPKPLLVRYPELDHEPRVAGVYLRVYVGGADVRVVGHENVFMFIHLFTWGGGRQGLGRRLGQCVCGWEWGCRKEGAVWDA